MPRLDDLPPEEHRRRFEALLAAGRARTASAPAIPPPGPLGDGLVAARETIDGGWYWTARVPAGMAVRLVAQPGTQGIAVMMWRADDPTERLNLADTVKVQWTARIGAGRLLLSDMGRVLASVVADSGAAHDALLGGGGGGGGAGGPGPRNNRDNFLLAAARFGLGARDIAPWMTFFADVRVTDDGRFAWGGGLQAEALVDLRAETDVFVAVSNAPHAMAPDDGEPPPCEVVVWRAPAPGADDACRTGSAEAVRAFANSAAALRP